MKKLFERWSKPLDKMVSVIGSKDQIKTCIVCNESNTAIGQLGDTVPGLQKAMNYLTERGYND